MKQYEILKSLRKENGLKQSELAKKLGIGQSTIVGYEKGLHEPTAEILSRYANFFNVSTDYLLGRTDDFGSVIAPVAPALSEDEAELVALYRSLLPDYKALALTNLRTWAGGAKSPKNAINHRA